MTTPQDTVRAMRKEITTLVDDAHRERLPVGAFGELIHLLITLDGQLAAMPGADAHSYCPECGLLDAPDPENPALVRVVQTCLACPSQWDAWDAEGQYYYLRFRSGRGSVETAESANAYRSSGPLTQVAGFRHGDPLDGSMGLAEFLAHAGMRMEATP